MDQLVKIPDIRMGDNSTRRVFKSKSLGVIINDVLLWSAHVAYIKKEKAIYGMKQIWPFVQRSLLNTMYKCLIQPQFDYCDVVWGNLSKGLAQSLQRLQNRAARIVT